MSAARRYMISVLAILLSVVSLVLLWPGLVQPALTIRATMEFFGTTQELGIDAKMIRGWSREREQIEASRRRHGW